MLFTALTHDYIGVEYYRILQTGSSFNDSLLMNKKICKCQSEGWLVLPTAQIYEYPTPSFLPQIYTLLGVNISEKCLAKTSEK